MLVQGEKSFAASGTANINIMVYDTHPHQPTPKMFIVAFLLLVPSITDAYIVVRLGNGHRIQSPLYAINEEDELQQQQEAITKTTKITINDGGSDLTDRFKYKVNALMGTYDPKFGNDDEHQVGNIMNALLNYPTNFTFTVVARTTTSAAVVDYVEATKSIISSISGDSIVDCVVTPRGERFTRLSITVMVESTGMIKAIYDALGMMEATVMKY